MSLLYGIYRRKTTTEEKKGGVLFKHAVLGAVLHLSRGLGEVLMSLSDQGKNSLEKLQTEDDISIGFCGISRSS